MAKEKETMGDVFQGLGNYWQAIFGSDNGVLSFLPQAIDGGEELPEVATRLEDRTEVRAVLHKRACVLLARPQGEEGYEVATCYPIFGGGIPRRVRIEGIHPWASGVEATIEATLPDCDGLSLSFYAPDWFCNSPAYAVGKEVDVYFSALALSAEAVEPEKTETIRGYTLSMAGSRILLPTNWASEFTYLCPIETVEAADIAGQAMHKLEVPLAGFDADAFKAALYLPAKMTEKAPQIGEALTGRLWMQGAVVGL
ncbi:MAG: hypothetical protein IKN64_02875 [Desulfovibrio sp.]|nr:hypothetical protein [Desulfovibrio sp.]